MASYPRSQSRAQEGQQRNRSASPSHIPTHIRQRPRLPPFTKVLKASSMQSTDHSPPQPPVVVSHKPLPHRFVSQGPGRQPFGFPDLFDRSNDWEVNRGSESLFMHRLQEQQLRLSTPASDEINWGPDPSPVPGEPLRPRPGFARTLDVMENFLPGSLPERHTREHDGRLETPLEDRPMETCEPEGRDPLLALQALRAEYIETEGRRLSELVQAHDRIRELEEELERNSRNDQALEVALWREDRVMLIQELDWRHEQQERVIEQQSGEIRALQARMPKPAKVCPATVLTAIT
ncbi:MAG: hypothetical protein Q9186_004502 [Xanthomendoza sp. 1 TL-2023]